MLKTDFTGRVAVITGSGCALDAALVKAFADNGAKVALCCKPSERPSSEALAGCANNVKIFDLDLSNFASIAGTFAEVMNAFGRVDVLVNNPMGAFVDTERVPLHETDLNKFISVTNEWFKGMMRFSKLAAGQMREQMKGSIVNVMSIRGITAVADQSITVGVSAGIHGMTRMWGVEMRDWNIRANGIAVGVLEDEPALECGDAVRFSHGNVKRPCTAEEAAAAVVFLASDAASYITGTVVPVDGGITAGSARSF